MLRHSAKRIVLEAQFTTSPNDLYELDNEAWVRFGKGLSPNRIISQFGLTYRDENFLEIPIGYVLQRIVEELLVMT